MSGMQRTIHVTAALAVAVSLSACSGSSGEPARQPTPPATKPSVVPATYPVGLVAVAGQPWVVQAGVGKVGPVGGPGVAVGATPLRATYDGRLVWVSVFGAGDVVAIDPATRKVVRRVKIGGEPEGIVSAFGHIWVVQQKAHQLAELASTGEVIATVPVGKEPRQVAASPSALYVSDFGSGRIFRINPRTKATLARRVCDGAQGMAAAKDALWVTCTSSDQVVTVEPDTLATYAHIPVAGEPDAIAIDGGQVYIVATDGPSLVQLPETPKQPRQPTRRSLGSDLPLNDQANVDLLIIGTKFWVSSPAGGHVVAAEL
jgi:YVTN family beta-propeller protein